MLLRSYKDSLEEYKKENRLLDKRDWISDKVVILFLESDRGHKVRAGVIFFNAYFTNAT